MWASVGHVLERLAVEIAEAVLLRMGPIEVAVAAVVVGRGKLVVALIEGLSDLGGEECRRKQEFTFDSSSVCARILVCPAVLVFCAG